MRADSLVAHARKDRISRGVSFDGHAHFSNAYLRRLFAAVNMKASDRGLRFVVMKRGQR